MNQLEPFEIKNRLKYIENPPRYVPFKLKVNLKTGIFGFIGGMFVTLGMIFVFIFVIAARVVPSIMFGFGIKTASGKIIAIERTNATVGGSKYSRGTPVIQYHFEFRDHNEKLLKQYSYNTGTFYIDNNIANVNDSVKIEYSIIKSKFARIEGMRYSIFGPFTLFTLLFPLIGMIFVIVGYRKGSFYTKLLKKGKIADGKVFNVEHTNMRINNIPVVAYYFEYYDERGQKQVSKSKVQRTAQIGDEELEPVLFITGKKSHAILVDELPNRVMLDSNGKWTMAGGKGGAVAGILLHTLMWAIIAFSVFFIVVDFIN